MYSFRLWRLSSQRHDSYESEKYNSQDVVINTKEVDDIVKEQEQFLQDSSQGELVWV